MKRASYREGVEYIALNDEPTETSADAMLGMASVQLLAAIFGVDGSRVAADVVRLRDRFAREDRRAERRAAAGAVARERKCMDAGEHYHVAPFCQPVTCALCEVPTGRPWLRCADNRPLCDECHGVEYALKEARERYAREDRSEASRVALCAANDAVLARQPAREGRGS